MNVKFLKPGTVNGSPVDVFIPNKGRSIRAGGENVIIDSYVEARIRCGSLVVAEPPKTNLKEAQDEYSI